MFKKAIDWISKNSRFVQAITAVVQVGIASLMLWTLIQSAETLSVTKRQLESSIEPVLDMVMSGSKLRLTNEGSVDIKILETIAIIEGNFNLTTRRISDYQVCRTRFLMCDTIKTGVSFEIDLSQHMVKILFEKPATDSFRVYCLVLRYRRSADMKPFTRFVPFTANKDGKTQTIDIYMPLFPSAGSSEVSSVEGFGSLEIARQELINLYKTKVIPEDM